ncbi:hypothetical protein KYY02_19000 [Streptomyces pimonensis]|uniref:Uncharacterized protein n=1 Tax=Streptomyces pimonensis TaxID=2860288 RepID=A0ABV4J5L9_9ACTN
MADLAPIGPQSVLKGADRPAGRDDPVSVAKSDGAQDILVEKPGRTGTKRFDGPHEARKAVLGDA